MHTNPSHKFTSNRHAPGTHGLPKFLDGNFWTGRRQITCTNLWFGRFKFCGYTKSFAASVHVPNNDKALCRYVVAFHRTSAVRPRFRSKSHIQFGGHISRWRETNENYYPKDHRGSNNNRPELISRGRRRKGH